MSCAAHPLNEAAEPCARCGTPYCDDCLVMLRDERVCAECKDEVVRDVISGTVVTGLPLARVGARGVAWLADHAMLWILQFGVTRFTTYIAWKFALDSSIGLRSLRVVAELGATLAFFIYEGEMVAARGQTLGKMLLRVRVVRPDGGPVTRRQAWVRASVRAASAIVTVAVTLGSVNFAPLAVLVLLILDYLPGMLSPERITIHDLLARTRVIRVDE